MRFGSPGRSAVPGPNLTAVLFIVLMVLAGCGQWKGSETVDTESAADRAGDGPGLVSGKEGGIVFYNDAWFGAAPDGGVEE